MAIEDLLHSDRDAPPLRVPVTQELLDQSEELRSRHFKVGDLITYNREKYQPCHCFRPDADGKLLVEDDTRVVKNECAQCSLENVGYQHVWNHYSRAFPATQKMLSLMGFISRSIEGEWNGHRE
jgi:hypothetical protein